ncbi:MAG: M48 family metallopeptidase [Sandaracinaceae bacterium]|nr:M48 family metallopeptidase [Sandaracinaceae bacterium]
MKRDRHQAELKERVRGWAKRIRVEPGQIRIQRMTRKWASCSSRGWCTFASDLVHEPVAFQDYVIVHELLHLKVRNHGRLFRSLMSAHVPGWRRFCPSGLSTKCTSGRALACSDHGPLEDDTAARPQARRP